MVKDKTKKSSAKDDKSNIRLSHLIAVSFASITTAFVSAKLTSVTSSLIILSLTSVVSTLAIEVYDKVLRKSTKFVAKAAAKIPYNAILPDSITDPINNKLLSAIEDTNDMNVATVGAGPHKSDSAGKTASEVIVSQNSQHESGAENEAIVAIEERPDLWHSWIGKAMTYLLVAVVVAIIGIGASALSAHWFDKPDQITDIYPQTALSKSDEKKLLDSASSSATKADSSLKEGLQGQINSLSAQISKLQDSVLALSKQDNDSNSANNSDASPSTEPNDSGTLVPSPSSTDAVSQQKRISDLEKTIKTLQSRIDTLQADVDALKTAESTGASTETD